MGDLLDPDPDPGLKGKKKKQYKYIGNTFYAILQFLEIFHTCYDFFTKFFLFLFLPLGSQRRNTLVRLRHVVVGAQLVVT